jgi:hypothetical protein
MTVNFITFALVSIVTDSQGCDEKLSMFCIYHIIFTSLGFQDTYGSSIAVTSNTQMLAASDMAELMLYFSLIELRREIIERPDGSSLILDGGFMKGPRFNH